MPMSTVFFIILLVIIVARHKRDRRYLDQRLDRYMDHHGNARPQAVADNSRLEREVEELRERVRVLERIATDSNNAEARESRRIAAEIESLRDKA